MEDTGVVLFVYDRPDHTRRVLDGLRRNDVDELYVFADGPEPDDDVDAIRETRSVVEGIDWCETRVVERETNWGLAENTIDGIDRVFEDNERLIMLEDDDVPSTDFIEYMQACLDEYEDETDVMHVSGYSPPIDLPAGYDHDVYFTYRDTTWGWGTWKSAWERYSREPAVVRRRIAENEYRLKRELDRAGKNVLPMLKAELRGQIDSWSVWWIWSILKHDGFCVNPVSSRIENIGHDGTGTHSEATDKYDVDVDDTLVDDGLSFPEVTAVDETINATYNRYNDPGLETRIKWELRALAGTAVRSIRRP